MAAAGPTELQVELDEFLGEAERCLVNLNIHCVLLFLWIECYSKQSGF